MHLVLFPFFALGLMVRLGVTILHASIFQISTSKRLILNVLLTLIALCLVAFLLIAPSAAAPLPPQLGISITHSLETQPIYKTVETRAVRELLHAYEYEVLQQPFTPQYRFINLAILAAAAHEPELAEQFAAAARALDPNQEFFNQ